ncbi:IS110 family transposase [uncultured Pseudokineococcus sp.]|uniref:IS110 family transposase n=1 Tax=uncultured Pseudokineococcus sp. TaxID=1642928 RepID=UPI00262B9542|nr:IS110 family transposase [uncultured Pseudokineococcus sp.]
MGGVDTHAETHTAAAVDLAGRTLGHATFPTTTAGYIALLRWLTGFTTTGSADHLTTGVAGEDTTRVVRIGVEGTGTYGAGLARYLRDVAGVEVVEVDRPDRRTRRFAGKSDPIDAEAAARAALNGHAAGTPKLRTGPVEAIRALRVARSSAVGARAQALVQMKSLITTAPQALRERLRALYTAPAKLVATCAALGPDPVVLATGDPTAAAEASLRALARRHQHLSEEITEADAVLDQLVAATAPTLLEALGVGTEVAGQLLVTAGDNPERLHSEAAFAALCGVSPVPAGSGRTDGAVRLNRGGDRQANSALHRVVITRLRHDQRTQTYLQRRTAQGKPKRAILRCLKRHVAREIYRLIMLDLAPTTTPRAT